MQMRPNQQMLGPQEKMKFATILGSLIILAAITHCGCRKQPGEITPIAPTMSVNAALIQQEAFSLLHAGRDHEALQKFREVLALHPDFKHVHSMVDELTQRTDPRAWLEQHPSDWGAWMSIFAELMNSNMFAEAEAHLKKLPHGHDPEKYRASLDNKRSFLQHRQKTGEVPTSASTATNQSALSTD